MNFWNFVNTRYCANTWYCVNAISCCRCGNYNFFNYNNLSFDLCIHKHMHTHACTHARTHTNTPTHPPTHPPTHTHTHTHLHTKWQSERNKLKYLHYVNKMIEKMQDEKVHFPWSFMLLARIMSKFLSRF